MLSDISHCERHVREKLCVLALLPALIIAIFSAGTIRATELQKAPLNPAYLEYVERLRTVGPPGLVTAQGYYLGHIPAPVDRVVAPLPRMPAEGRVGVPPDAYDLRTSGPGGTPEVTPVRDQGDCGSCWAHATMASLESWLLKVQIETWNLSENSVKECHGFLWGPCEGGNAWISTAVLARLDGPISETDDPYYDYSTGCNTEPCLSKHLREVWRIWGTTAIKNEIMDKGAMYTAFYYNPFYYFGTTHSYYYDGSSSVGTNHAVAVVGWNDNYNRNNFPSTPPGDGAWIYKNSWGTGWGESGYFYLSYYDTFSAAYCTLFLDAYDPAGYSSLYQYDPLGWVTSVGYGTTEAWAVNVFTARQAGTLEDVAFYTTDPGASYAVYIKRGGPDGTEAVHESGTCTYIGYHRHHLSSPVHLTDGETFSVVVKLNNPYYSYPIAAEYADAGYSPSATANPEESYVSPDGSPGSWDDLTDTWPTMNACIKAFVLPDTPTTDTALVFRVDDFGSVFSDGSYYGSTYSCGRADVAEWVPVSESVEPGDVLELDPDNPGYYRKARSKCSTLVAGVVSTEPGVILGSSSPTPDIGPWTLDSALLALLGIVAVKVTDENGPIQPGDLLVASSTPGIAMRWDLDNRSPCDFVGKALEPLETGTGVIQVLLMH